MLSNLFRLDGEPRILADGEMPSMLPDETVVDVVFPPGTWTPTSHRIKGVTFRRVAFSKNIISQVTFTDCHFEDCLFTGAQLEDVEFHGCKFINCTLWKMKLSKVYLRPDCVKFSRKFRVDAANVGISIFQAMLANFAEERQDHFFMQADIRFRRWKRYQIWFDLKEEKRTIFEAWWEYLSSITYEVLTGFGYRPFRVFLWTVAIFLGISWVNHELIGANLSTITTNSTGKASFIDTVFYSFSVLTVLGFSTVTPASDGAKILTVFEALASIGWLGIFTAVLVKRFMR